MKNYMVLWHDSVRATGGLKAKEDTNDFFKKQGYQVIDTPYGKITKILYVFCVLPFIFLKIRSGNIIVQFPSGVPFIQKMMFASIKRLSGANLILIIHDIESLRIHADDKYQKENMTELALLKKADGIVSLNDVMTKFLKEHGITAEITELNIWDYDNPCELKRRSYYVGSICFAGNLDKSLFLYKYDLKHKLLVFGKKNTTKPFPEQIKYGGIYTPEELPSKLDANFGLIWDGDELDTCSGNYGRYLRYNAPHKTSLYLSSGLPVIVWQEAAIAKVITKYDCGLTIDSLENLDELLDSVTKERYEELVNNAMKVAEVMRQGKFMQQAIDSLIASLDERKKDE